MKNRTSRLMLAFMLWTAIPSILPAVDLSYYLPDSIPYDPSVPPPSRILGYEPGTWHVSHDKLVEYMYAMAAASPRVTVKEYGRTYEGRPLLYVIITAPENRDRLEEMRQEHLAWCDPERSAATEAGEVPLVVLLSYTIHGNEASGANASLLTVYYLAAAQDPGLTAFLKKNIILVDPTINPDGYSRFSAWVNSRRSLHPSGDPSDDEFYEPWPRGRGNHYWFDMNRDYLLLVNRESRARVRQFYRWRPNIVTDHHEMGSSSTFFFQPGIPSRNNPLTPGKNYDLTARIARYHASFLDRIGSQYFSQEVFDDYYYGKGSSFPDINGGIGILFEQGSVRGHVRETPNGRLTFPFAIRNQFTVSLSTLAAARHLREELLAYQRSFFVEAMKEARHSSLAGYLFGDADDPVRTALFVRLLQAHQIRVEKAEGNSRDGMNYFVPAVQPQYRLIQALFEKRTHFRDSTFYDVSTWTLPLAYNIPYREVTKRKGVLPFGTSPVNTPHLPAEEIIGGTSHYGYLIDGTGYRTPRLLARILSRGIKIKVAMAPFEYDDGTLKKSFSYGTLFIPVQNQTVTADSLYRLLQETVKGTGKRIFAVRTGLTPSGIDLGSGQMVPLKAPKALLFTGDGVSSYEAGEIWHYFDRVLEMPLTLTDNARAGSLNLERYNIILMAGGSYSGLSANFLEDLKRWVRKGGTVIALKRANRYLAAQDLLPLHFLPSPRVDSSHHDPYQDAFRGRALEMINGTILNARLELSHPLCYGYMRQELPVFRNTTLAVEDDRISYYHRPVTYTGKPLLSGYISSGNLERLRNTPSVIVTPVGGGRIISFLDDPLFRGYFLGTQRLFANAVFFRELIR